MAVEVLTIAKLCESQRAWKTERLSASRHNKADELPRGGNSPAPTYQGRPGLFIFLTFPDVDLRIAFEKRRPLKCQVFSLRFWPLPIIISFRQAISVRAEILRRMEFIPFAYVERSSFRSHE